MEFEGKKVLVIGTGLSGMGAAQMLSMLGARVTILDNNAKAEVEKIRAGFERILKKEEIDKLNIMVGPSSEEKAVSENMTDGKPGFDLVVPSPGVPLDSPLVMKMKDAGIPVISEIELGYLNEKGRVIAITGTNGKTTTTTLVGDIMKAYAEQWKAGSLDQNRFPACSRAIVVGNIGKSYAAASMDTASDTVTVGEISSFQLEAIDTFHPVVSAILNITPDHLNRHKTMENYGAAKARVFENQDENQYLVINYDDKVCYELAKDCRAKVVPFSRIEELEFGAFVKDEYIVIKNEQGELIRFCKTEELNIPGTHNLENALAAAAVAYFAGIDADVITRALVEFQGVEHRIEFCGEVDGVRFVNDSKGTNPEASIKAIDAMKGGVVLIAGGYDKGSTFDELIEAFNGKVKHMVLLGKTAPMIKETAEKLGFTNSIIVEDMEQCVNEGFRLAEKGDTVLLSPACASWDMYKSFEQRGEHFKECVAKLTK